jgi:hypothetical protein
VNVENMKAGDTLKVKTCRPRKAMPYEMDAEVLLPPATIRRLRKKSPPKPAPAKAQQLQPLAPLLPAQPWRAAPAVLQAPGRRREEVGTNPANQTFLQGIRTPDAFLFCTKS